MFALLPAGAMALGLALQTNLAVELGFDDNQVAQINLWSVLVNAVFTVIGGQLSDKLGRRRMLAIYIALMTPPTIWLALQLQQYGWVMPVDVAAPNRPAVPAALVTALWIAVIAYNVGNGLMYGTRSAIFMDVTNPRVAATQFTAYMALMNLNIAYSASWQGIASEAVGYPRTLWIDAIFGLACLALIPFVVGTPGNRPDGRAPGRARLTAIVLGLACLAWLPYRLTPDALGQARPIAEIALTVVFVGAALFLLAGAAVLTARRGRAWLAAGAWLAPLLLAMYARRWSQHLPGFADVLFTALPVIGGVLLLTLAWRSWQELNRQDEADARAEAAVDPAAGLSA
jgi:PAT family beta-lactamase induction signal transducer AmpG